MLSLTLSALGMKQASVPSQPSSSPSHAAFAAARQRQRGYVFALAPFAYCLRLLSRALYVLFVLSLVCVCVCLSVCLSVSLSIRMYTSLTCVLCRLVLLQTLLDAFLERKSESSGEEQQSDLAPSTETKQKGGGRTSSESGGTDSKKTSKGKKSGTKQEETVKEEEKSADVSMSMQSLSLPSVLRCACPEFDISVPLRSCTLYAEPLLLCHLVGDLQTIPLLW